MHQLIFHTHSSTPVKVRLQRLGRVIVDHNLDTADVESSGSNVCCKEKGHLQEQGQEDGEGAG